MPSLVLLHVEVKKYIHMQWSMLAASLKQHALSAQNNEATRGCGRRHMQTGRWKKQKYERHEII